MKVLLAEDEPAFRQLLEGILVKWGYEVVSVGDGIEAWKALQPEDAPRIAILDWMMPGLEGVEVCRKVRKERPEPYTYIILLTSQNRDVDIVTGMEAGADDYITKPCQTNELKVRLNAGKRIVDLQSELMAAHEDLGAFGYAVSNEILNSLMMIGDNAKAIEEMICTQYDEQCRSYTKRIYGKTRHLGQLIGVMHDFFQPKRIEPRWETVNLSGMAGETAARLRLRNPDRRASFRIGDGIEANCDANLLRVVLRNLFDNAWKHTASSEEAVIEFGVTESNGRPTYFVRDNGTGFDPADADKLFKPFQWLPGTEDFAGEGVGLATVHRIIRRHGGKVWAEGAPGKGATFYFTW